MKYYVDFSNWNHYGAKSKKNYKQKKIIVESFDEAMKLVWANEKKYDLWSIKNHSINGGDELYEQTTKTN